MKGAVSLSAVAHTKGVVFTSTGLEFRLPLPFAQWDALGLRLRDIEGAVQWWEGPCRVS